MLMYQRREKENQQYLFLLTPRLIIPASRIQAALFHLAIYALGKREDADILKDRQENQQY